MPLTQPAWGPFLLLRAISRGEPIRRPRGAGPRRTRGSRPGPCGGLRGRRGGAGGRSRARSEPANPLPASASRNDPSGRTPSVTGRWESQPLPALFDRCTWASRRPEPVERSRAGRGRRPRRGWCRGRRGRTARGPPSVRTAWNAPTFRPRTRTREHVLHRDVGRPVRSRASTGAPRVQRRYAVCHRYGRVDHDERSADALGELERAIDLADRVGAPDGRVINRNGAWIATIASECSSASSSNRRASRVSGSLVTITSTLLEPGLREEREHIVERRRDEAHRRACDPRSAGGFGHGDRC